jgi:outer membrane beta-barrel protein
MSRLWILCLLLSVNAFAQNAKTAPSPVPPAEIKESGEISTTGSNVPKLMDGVELEAVETYINPTQNQLGLGIGIYPFDAYFYGLSINAGYTYHSSRTFAWEVLHAQYFLPFQKDLTTELADIHHVAPQSIPKLNFIISTDIQYVFAYGKMAMFEEFIRYFRISSISGLGAVKMTDETNAAAILGVKFETFTRDSFSWTFEIRDQLTIPGFNNYMTFILGTGISF